ncbi:MAG: hypothetical protein WAZ18_00995 [Alphaproteobacteria bacterium]
MTYDKGDFFIEPLGGRRNKGLNNTATTPPEHGVDADKLLDFVKNLSGVVAKSMDGSLRVMAECQFSLVSQKRKKRKASPERDAML